MRSDRELRSGIAVGLAPIPERERERDVGLVQNFTLGCSTHAQSGPFGSYARRRMKSRV